MFSGTYTALVSPFLNDRLDDESYARLIEHQIAGGINGIVPVGTTGESPTVSHDEHLTLVKRAVEIAKGRCQVIAGAGSNSTRKSIETAKECEQLGATGLLLVAPYYNKPSPEGMFRHFRDVAAATKLPVILYNIPGRCGVEIAVDVVHRLAVECPTIVSIKEAGGTPERVSQMRQVLPPEFSILSGDDSLTLPFLAVGAVGVVSVASNLIPNEVVALVKHFLDGQPLPARVLHEAFYPLFKEIFVEPNPVAMKLALVWKGIIASAEVRGPLCEASRENTDRLHALLIKLQLL